MQTGDLHNKIIEHARRGRQYEEDDYQPRGGEGATPTPRRGECDSRIKWKSTYKERAHERKPSSKKTFYEINSSERAACWAARKRRAPMHKKGRKRAPARATPDTFASICIANRGAATVTPPTSTQHEKHGTCLRTPIRICAQTRTCRNRGRRAARNREGLPPPLD